MLASLAYAITHRCQKFKLAGSFFQTVNELYISCAYSRANRQSDEAVQSRLDSSPCGSELESRRLWTKIWLQCTEKS